MGSQDQVAITEFGILASLDNKMHNTPKCSCLVSFSSIAFSTAIKFLLNRLTYQASTSPLNRHTNIYMLLWL